MRQMGGEDCTVVDTDSLYPTTEPLVLQINLSGHCNWSWWKGELFWPMLGKRNGANYFIRKCWTQRQQVQQGVTNAIIAHKNKSLILPTCISWLENEMYSRSNYYTASNCEHMYNSIWKCLMGKTWESEGQTAEMSHVSRLHVVPFVVENVIITILKNKVQFSVVLSLYIRLIQKIKSFNMNLDVVPFHSLF